jgi:hypothetical protein
MSQQEFIQEPQSFQSYEGYHGDWQSLSGAQSAGQSYRWSKQAKGGGTQPKSDHPSTFEDFLPPFSYPAQDLSRSSQQANTGNSEFRENQESKQSSRQNSHRQNSYQYGYQYTFRSVPWWAQAPRERTMSLPSWMGFLIITFILLMAVPLLFSIGAFLITLFFFLSLLPVFIIFAPIAIFVLIPLIRILGTDERYESTRSRRSYSQSWWW